MSRRKHRLQKVKESTTDYFSHQRTANNQVQKKEVPWRTAEEQKDETQSPDATGKFHFQRHTLREIYRQLTDGDDEVICNIAAWKNNDQRGPYLTVEVSPEFVPYERQWPNSDSFDDMFNEEDE